MKTLIERLRNAIEDGEVLTVTYSGGHCPGAKRRILPIRVAGHLLYARSIVSMAIKTYRLDGISLVSDDYPAPWIDESSTSRQRATRVDPLLYFSTWAFTIEKALWPALGVTLREYVDKDRSAALKASVAIGGNGDLGSKRTTVKVLAYAVGNPPVLDFHEGDLFLVAEQKLGGIQVVAKRKLIEVHQIDVRSGGVRTAYQMIDSELAEWLRTGVVPDHAQIDPSQSYSEVLRFSIKVSQPWTKASCGGHLE